MLPCCLWSVGFKRLGARALALPVPSGLRYSMTLCVTHQPIPFLVCVTSFWGAASVGFLRKVLFLDFFVGVSGDPRLWASWGVQMPSILVNFGVGSL